MAVQGTESPRSSVNTDENKKGGKQDTKAWIKKNKLLVGAAGVGGIVLLMAHKGKSTEGAGELAQKQAEENERAAAEAGSIIPAATPPARAGAGEGAGESGSTGSGGIAQSPASQEGTVDSSVAAALEKNTNAIENVSKDLAENQAAGTTTKPASKTATKPKAKKPVKKSTSKKHSHSGVTVHGRHFPGAKSHATTKVRTDSKGKTSHEIKVNHGGHTTTHISHDKGKSWTDHPAGSGSPKKTTQAKSHPAHTIPPLRSKRGVEKYLTKKPAKPAPKRYKRVRA